MREFLLLHLLLFVALSFCGDVTKDANKIKPTELKFLSNTSIQVFDYAF